MTEHGEREFLRLAASIDYHLRFLLRLIISVVMLASFVWVERSLGSEHVEGIAYWASILVWAAALPVWLVVIGKTIRDDQKNRSTA